MTSPTTTPEPQVTTTAASRVTTHLFAATVVFFLLAGLVIVLGQAVLLGLADADAARDWADTMAPYAFGGASVAGLLSFALSYWHGPDHGTDTDDD